MGEPNGSVSEFYNYNIPILTRDLD